MQQTTLTAPLSEAEMINAIGPNWQSFIACWRKMGPELALKPHWSWAAGIGGGFWLLYRRMYLPALVAMSAEIGSMFLPTMLKMAVTIVICLTLGLFGEALAVRHAAAVVRRVRTSGQPGPEMQRAIAHAGRTDMMLPSAYVAASLAMMMVASGISPAMLTQPEELLKALL